MVNIVDEAIKACNKYRLSFCKFLSSNDTGASGSNQAGIYIPLISYKILFDKQGERGSNKDKFVKIRWQNDFETDSRFVYYGMGTRNEYRITRFGKGFPFLRDEHSGDLFVFVKAEEDYYYGYIISSDDDIDCFLSTFNLTPADTNNIISESSMMSNRSCLDDEIHGYIENLDCGFPTTNEISKAARNLYYKCEGKEKDILLNPDKTLIRWLELEFNLFKCIENHRYKDIVCNPIGTVDKLIEYANTILNRRKSRAGKSLEHHLSEIFLYNKIFFDEQCITEGSKKPDFIFPGYESYHNSSYESDRLVFLGAKTTCKDRWRQILNEADRIKVKHLFTLQQGISQNQLEEMYSNNVILVTPKEYIKTFSEPYRDKIMSLKDFIVYVKNKYEED